MIGLVAQIDTVSDYGKPWITVGIDLQYLVENRVLYLQPTSSSYDWRKNLKVKKEWFGEGENRLRVHKGFLESYMQGREVLLKILKSGDVDSVCGYSHGAALAVLLYWDYYGHTRIKFPVFTIGCPRVVSLLTSKKKRDIFSEILNVQIETDIVTRVPPVVFLYRHIGVLCRLVSSSLLPTPKDHYASQYKKLLLDIRGSMS